MPVRAQEASLKTRNARAPLPARVKPYYRRVLGDLQLGYYSPQCPSGNSLNLWNHL